MQSIKPRIVVRNVFRFNTSFRTAVSFDQSIFALNNDNGIRMRPQDTFIRKRINFTSDHHNISALETFLPLWLRHKKAVVQNRLRSAIPQIFDCVVAMKHVEGRLLVWRS